MNTPLPSSAAHAGRGASRWLIRVVGTAGLCAMALCGCTDLSTPAYRRPDMPEKGAWAHTSRTFSAADTVNPQWWKAFDDPYLNTLIEKAIAGNIDIRVLAARIGVAGAQIGEVQAGALPTVDAGAGIDYEKSTGLALSKTYNVATQVNWDIDIWGKVEKACRPKRPSITLAKRIGVQAI